ncbi:hypothetical protein QPK87_05290 [Kamptonema cortianum]|nr:hypothetical protein [Geitlerinema splendidum]MDK3155991.1 hypothetical protein [Kamptonema cortianum]
MIYGLIFIGVVGLVLLIQLVAAGWFLVNVRRATPASHPKLTALIVCNNDDATILQSLPILVQEFQQVIVYIISSEKGLLENVRDAGAEAILDSHGSVDLFHAFERLSLIASETSQSDWWVMVNGRYQVLTGFANHCSGIVAKYGHQHFVFTGFVKYVPANLAASVGAILNPLSILRNQIELANSLTCAVIAHGPTVVKTMQSVSADDPRSKWEVAIRQNLAKGKPYVVRANHLVE